MHLNREKVAAVSAFLIFLFFGVFSVYSSIGRQMGSRRPYRPIPPNLNESSLEVLEVEPRIFQSEREGRRDPFHFASVWQPVEPEPLPPPPLYPDRRPRVFFGFLKNRSNGAPILYQDVVGAQAKEEGGTDAK